MNKQEISCLKKKELRFLFLIQLSPYNLLTDKKIQKKGGINYVR